MDEQDRHEQKEHDNVEIVDLAPTTIQKSEQPKRRDDRIRRLRKALPFAIGISSLILIIMVVQTVLPSINLTSNQTRPTPTATVSSNSVIQVQNSGVDIDNKIAFLWKDNELKAVSLENGRLLWSWRTKQNIYSISKSTLHKLIFVEDGAGMLVAMQEETGKGAWWFREQFPFDFVVNQDTVTISTSRRIVLLHTPDGVQQWQYMSPDISVISQERNKITLLQNGSQLVKILDMKTSAVLHYYNVKGRVLKQTEKVFYVQETGKGIAVLEVSTGKQLWSYHYKDQETDTIVIGEAIYLLDSSSTLHAIDPTTGQEIWKTRGKKEISTIILEKEGLQYLNQQQNNGVDLLDYRTGKVLWHSNQPNSYLTACANNLLCYLSDSNTTSVLKRSNEQQLWQVRGTFMGSSNTSIYVLSDNGLLLSLDSTTGRQLWSAKGGQGSTLLCRDEQILILLQYNNSLTGLNPADGKTLWEYHIQ